MRLVYLPWTRSDLRWLRHYYTRVFPEGAAAARARILAMERLILDNPISAGQPSAPGSGGSRSRARRSSSSIARPPSGSRFCG